MTWDQLQQVIRILLYAAGGYFLNDTITSGELFQGAVAGVLSIGSFVWWYAWERNRTS